MTSRMINPTPIIPDIMQAANSPFGKLMRLRDFQEDEVGNRRAKAWVVPLLLSSFYSFKTGQ